MKLVGNRKMHGISVRSDQRIVFHRESAAALTMPKAIPGDPGDMRWGGRGRGGGGGGGGGTLLRGEGRRWRDKKEVGGGYGGS